MVHIHDIESIEDWTKHYVEEGQRFLTKQLGSGTNSNPSLEKRKAAEQHLRLYIPKALQIKGAQLQASNSHEVIVASTTIASTLPFGKWIASSIGSGAFRKKVIRQYGLKYDEPVFQLVLQAMFDAGVIQSEPRSLTGKLIDKARKYAKEQLEFAWNEGGLQEEVHDEVIRQFGEEVGEEILSEAATLIPIFGTVISCKMGELKAIKKLDEIIQSTKEVALRVHKSIVIPVVLEKLGLGFKRIQESQPKKIVPVTKPESAIKSQNAPHPRQQNKDTHKVALEPTPNFIFITVFALLIFIILSPQFKSKSQFQNLSVAHWVPIQLAVVFWTAFWRRTIWRGGNWTLFHKLVLIFAILLLANLVLITAIAYEIGSVLGMYGS